ncbi:hypothetical protein BKA63DRAFT_261794 [Paraphoma chrysanthemicola]|nr:hypothetical protein BKA63DRAFT_261794 [Paraphoma chrysanthemicola]
MRIHLFTCFVCIYCIAYLPVLIAGTETNSLPECAVQCINTSLSKSSCNSAQNTSCVCSDATFRLNVVQCFSTACTPKETLSSLNTTSFACGDPIRDRSGFGRTANIVLIVLAMCAVIARYAAQIVCRRFHLPSDVNMGLIVALDIPVAWIADRMTRIGLGRDIWTLPFDNITQILKYYWAGEMLYFALTWLIRIAFVLFFFQVFIDQTFRRVLWAVIAIYLAAMISGILSVAFLCTPVSFAWQSWDGENKGRCIDHNAVVFAQAAFTIVADIVTIGLALSQIWHLQMSLKKKISVVLMFSIGIFIMIVAAIRLKSLVLFAKTPNPTWDSLNASVWSAIELQVGIICICMPSIRLGLNRLMPKTMGSSRQQGTGTSYGSGRVFEGHGSAKGRAFTASRVSRPQVEDTESFVQLVDIDTKGSSGRSSHP